jgi:ABC-2 type transport system permease protein
MNPFAYEWVRIKTIRSTWIIVGLSSLFTLGLTIIVALYQASHLATGETYDRDWSDVVGGSLFALSWLFGTLLGIFAFGHEYRHGTMRPTLSALPRRRQLALAKFLIPALVIVAVVAVSGLVGLVIGRLVLGDHLVEGWTYNHLVTVVAMTLLRAALWAILGAAFTAVLRSQIGALVSLLVWSFVLEPLVTLVLNIDALKSVRFVAKFLPKNMSDVMASVADRPGNSAFEFLSWSTGAIGFTLFTLALAAMATELFARRDA